MKTSILIRAAILVIIITIEGMMSSLFSQVSTLDSLDTSYLNWYNLDMEKDEILGSKVNRVYDELLKDKTPKEKIVVAVIDGGVDVNHEDLQGQIWVNKDEILDNGIDDDNNGYIDDIHGWNYIGNHEDGSDVREIYAAVRVYKELDPKYEAYESVEKVPDAQKKEYEMYLECRDFYTSSVKKHKQTLKTLESIEKSISYYEGVISEFLNKKDLDYEEICAIKSSEPRIERARNFLCEKYEEGYTKRSIKRRRERSRNSLEGNLNIDLDSRELVGDDVNDINDTKYGVNDVGTNNYHGTFVAGIIAANRNNGIGIDGIAQNAEIMCLKVVPNGDEHDKDVALSIRYAVDNGARIINMSFGKNYSFNKQFVDDAFKYAEEHDVLLIHAAGNEAVDLDEVSRYPTIQYNDGSTVKNWIDVGAHSKTLDKYFCGIFTNYGQEYVDFYAPGVKILSLSPGSKYAIKSGTSFSCPATAGVAALILSYYPDFTALEIKEILIESCTEFPKLKVYKPGFEEKREKTKFSTLSRKGGILNALEAMKLAEKKYKIK